MLTKQNVEPAEYVLHLSHSFPGFIVLRFYGKLFLLNQRIFHFLSVFSVEIVKLITSLQRLTGTDTTPDRRLRSRLGHGHQIFLDLAV